MNTVIFRNWDTPSLFVLNSAKQLETVPIVGDEIRFFERDFQSASFRMRPHKTKKYPKGILLGEFKVVKRILVLSGDNPEWELQ